MTYNNVTVYYDKENNFKKAVINTNFGDLEINNKNDFDNFLNEYALQNDLTVDELYDRNDFIKIVKDKSESKVDSHSSIDLTEQEIGEIVLDIEEKEKKNKKSWIKRLVAGTAIVVILGTGSYHLDKRYSIFGKKFYALFHPEKKVENMVNVNYASNSDDNYTNNVNSGSSNGSEYDKVMSGVINREQKNNQIISQLVTGNTVELSNEEILQAINDNSRSANSSIFEVSQYINDRGLHGTAYYCSFEKLFTSGSVDYNAVKMFSDMRNDIVKTVFQSKNKTAAISKIDAFYNLYTEFVMVGPCKFTLGNQSYVINYNDLSDMAKATILEIGSAMFTIDLDYTYNDGKYKFKKDEIYNDSVSMLEGELLPRLINKSYHK